MATKRSNINWLGVEKAIAEIYGPTVSNLDRSLWEMLLDTANHYPDDVAVISFWQEQHRLNPESILGADTHRQQQSSAAETEICTWTYSQLVRIVESLATWLRDRGCTKGKYLVAFVWNSVEWGLFLWVAAKLEMPFVPLGPLSVQANARDYFSLLEPYVLVVQDETIARDLREVGTSAQIQISCSNPSSELGREWLSLADILSSLFTKVDSSLAVDKYSTASINETALVVFTSGTTSTPKACLHTASNLWSVSTHYGPIPDKPNKMNRIIHTPVWHIFAVIQALRGWRHGSTVVFPSPKFDPAATLYALKVSRSSIMAAVPAISKALREHPSFPGKESMSTTTITMGGMVITEENIRYCEEELGCRAFVGFGLSEGAPLTEWHRASPLVKDRYYSGVGMVLPGTMLRICSPGSRQPLKRNDFGELHVGGTSVIKGYIGGLHADTFYDDNAGNWFITGDQARIDENGALHIVGRYKDLIIRGGKNVAPEKIELCLEQFSGVTVQVVGIPDEIAGELPVAVLETRATSYSTSEMVRSVVQSLGPMYALESIITLEELGLEQFPRTAFGKVRKNVLKAEVIRYKRSHSPQIISGSIQDSINQLRSIWADLINTSPGMISVTASVLEWADSVTLLRYSHKVWRQLGKKLYLQDFSDNQTIEQQAELLDQRSIRNNLANFPLGEYQKLPQQKPKDFLGLDSSSMSFVSEPRYGPPLMTDVVIADGDACRFHQIVDTANKTLDGFGLTWETDVEDIVPIRDTRQALVRGPRPQSYRSRAAYKINNTSVHAVRDALEKGLSSRPMFRTICAHLPDMTPLHIIVRPGRVLYDSLITTRDTMSLEAIQAILQDDSSVSFDQIQMIQVVIAPIQNSTSAALIMTYNHSTFDALSMIPWLTDLDRLLLDGDAKLDVLTPYKKFADLKYQYEGSLPATIDVRFHTNRLRGISKLTRALWPPKLGPGWMIGNDDGSEHYSVRAESRKKRNIVREKYPRVYQVRSLPNLEVLRHKRSVPPYIVVKTAIALFNIRQTGQEYAIFNSVDAGRSWPFVPAWIESQLPPAMSIDGPTICKVMNMIRIVPGETCGDLLQKMQRDHDELSLHVHAPWFKILDALDDEGPLLSDASMRQTVNWDASLRSRMGSTKDFLALQSIGRVNWPDCGFFWNCGMLDAERLAIVSLYDDTHIQPEMVDSYICEVLDIVQWIIDPENWNCTVPLKLSFISKDL